MPASANNPDEILLEKLLNLGEGTTLFMKAIAHTPPGIVSQTQRDLMLAQIKTATDALAGAIDDHKNILQVFLKDTAPHEDRTQENK